MKIVNLTASEIRSLEHFLWSNPCSCGCVYPEMTNSRKSCNECKLNIDRYKILEKVGLL